MKKYAVYYSLLDNGYKFGFYCPASDSDKAGSDLKENLLGYAATKRDASRMLKDNGCVNC